MTDRDELVIEIEVPGTPEEVWAAIATGPGISSWYVPHQIEEAAGGAASASFGPGMEVDGRVAEWEPPRKVRFEGTEDGPGLAFEWTVEAASGSTCTVRLVNSGFGSGDDWNEEFYNAMDTGWRTFFANLRLHLEHFAGQEATPSLAMAMWPTDPDEAWTRLLGRLGLDHVPVPGDAISLDGDMPALSGTVTEVVGRRITLLLDQPAAGTGFITAESQGEGTTSVSVWLYLYGDDRTGLASDAYDAWTTWLTASTH